MVVNHTPLCDAIVALYRSIRRGAGGEYRRVSSSSVCARGRGATVARVVASRDEEEIDGRGEGKQRKTTHALADATNDTVRARVAKPRPRPRWTMDLNVNEWSARRDDDDDDDDDETDDERDGRRWTTTGE